MSFEFERNGSELLIQVGYDKFDASLSASFRESLDRAWEEGISTVTIDFSKVEFVDSSGVGALVSAYKRVAPKGKLRLLSPSAPVTGVIELLRLHRVFELVPG